MIKVKVKYILLSGEELPVVERNVPESLQAGEEIGLLSVDGYPNGTQQYFKVRIENIEPGTSADDPEVYTIRQLSESRPIPPDSWFVEGMLFGL